MSHKVQRNLDGVYFRIQRDGRWGNVCYSDLTPEEREELAARRAERSTPEEQAEWWRSLAEIMADQLYDMGEQLGVTCE